MKGRRFVQKRIRQRLSIRCGSFFSSVKVGIWLIVLLLVTSSLGTVYPQEMYIPPTANPADHYFEEYGFLGQLYYQLGFHNLYGSWWYMLLIAALGTSIIVASLDRFIPLYRALKKQRVTRHEGFMKRQRVFGQTVMSEQDQDLAQVQQQLKNKRYKVSEENGNLLARKIVLPAGARTSIILDSLFF